MNGQTIGESIRKLRLSFGLTQEQFGTAVGVSSMAVSQWENGRAVPRMGAVQRMSSYFNVPKSAIMGDDYEHAIREDALNALRADERELLELYRSLDASGREMALCAVRGMASHEHPSHVAEGKLA